MQVVVSWPTGAGLLGGKEYKNFCERAYHLNYNLPDGSDESFENLNYSPIIKNLLGIPPASCCY